MRANALRWFHPCNCKLLVEDDGEKAARGAARMLRGLSCGLGPEWNSSGLRNPKKIGPGHGLVMVICVIGR